MSFFSYEFFCIGRFHLYDSYRIKKLETNTPRKSKDECIYYPSLQTQPILFIK